MTIDNKEKNSLLVRLVSSETVYLSGDCIHSLRDFGRIVEVFGVAVEDLRKFRQQEEHCCLSK